MNKLSIFYICCTLIFSLTFLGCRKKHWKAEEGLPSKSTVHGSITAKQGFEGIKSIANKWANDSFLDLVASGGDIFQRTYLGQMINIDGRINSHGAWGYRFISSSKGRLLWIDLEFDGTLKARSTDILDGFIINPYRPLCDNWLDSNDIMKLAEKIRGDKFRDRPWKIFDIIMRLENNPRDQAKSHPRWQVTYIAHYENKLCHHLTVDLDPMTGKIIQTDEFSVDPVTGKTKKIGTALEIGNN